MFDDQLGPPPSYYDRELISNPGDENALLLTAGLDPLTPVQLQKIKPYWLDIVNRISEMDASDLDNILAFSNRMKTDEDFARQWVAIV